LFSFVVSYYDLTLLRISFADKYFRWLMTDRQN